jgi:DNA-directed RNA polymerase specialized sigma24 family protein
MASMLRHRSRRKRGGRHPAIAPVASPLKSSVAVLVERLANPRAETGSQSVARDEMVLAIREGLAALPGDQRAAVEACYLQGQDLGATAEELTKTPAAVRGLLHRAKQALRETLGRTSRWFYIR